jgi:tRNA(Ile)-lysidine synthetase-like protein
MAHTKNISILAISGGPDSVYLFHQLLNKGEKPILAHFNHQLRGQESDEDERFVKQLAAKHELVFERDSTNVADYAQTHKQSTETAGRTLRYEFLEKVREKHNANKIYLAHHLNDNLETVIMNERRGCGLRGQIGMLENNGWIVRPLLDTPKETILEWLHDNEISYCIDASNQDTKFTRNWIRHILIPQKLKEEPHLLEVFKKKRATSQQAYNELKIWASSWLKNNAPTIKAFLNLTEEKQQFLLLHCYEKAHGSTFNLTTAQIKEVQKMIRNGHGGKQRTLGKNLTIRLEQGEIKFEQKPLSPLK